MVGAFYKIRRKIVSAFTGYCLACGKAAPHGKALCKSCEALLTVPPAEMIFDIECVTAHHYREPAQNVLTDYKFSEEKRIFIEDTLTDWLCEAYENNYSGRNFDFVIPVPAYGTDKTRLSEVVKRFAIMENLRFAPSLLCKNRATQCQHLLSSVERKINLIGAFSAKNEVRGKKILLVDDVVTTGSTIRECAAALFEQGAREISVLAILRTAYE